MNPRETRVPRDLGITMNPREIIVPRDLDTTMNLRDTISMILGGKLKIYFQILKVVWS